MLIMIRYSSIPTSFSLVGGRGSSASDRSTRSIRSRSDGARRSRSRPARVAISTRYAATLPQPLHHRVERFRAPTSTLATLLRAERLERIVEVLELFE